jgi:hypothetical protein
MRLWVIGDSWTDPSYGGWGWSCGWPERVAARFGMGLVNSGCGGSGYVRTGSPSGLNHPMQAARGAGAGADLAVLWGSINDLVAEADPQQVHDNAAGALALVRAVLAPGAPIIVYGPQGTDAPIPDLMLAHRDAVASAAFEAGALFGDPLLWMQGRGDLLDPSTHHPTCDGHAYLADRVAADLSTVLAERSGVGTVVRTDPDVIGWVMPWDLTAEAAPNSTVLPVTLGA